MPRYIDVENIELKGIPVFDQNIEMLIPLSAVRKSLQMTPTAEVQEVRHGRWERSILANDFFRCSDCSAVWNRKFEYCPHCGAKMDLED